MASPARFASLFLLALLLPAPAAAGGPVTLAFEATESRTEGPAQWNGSLAGYQVESTDVALRGEFTLAAKEIRIRAVVRDPTVDPGSGAPNLGLLPQEENTDLTEATITGIDTRAGLDLRVFALPGVVPPSIAMASGCVDFTAPSGTEAYAARVPRTTGDRSPSFDASKTVRADSCGAIPSCSISGNFLVTLWEWDYSVTDDGRTWTEHSGRAPASTPVAQPAPVAWSRREVFLHVEDGVLACPDGGSRARAWFAQEATATVAGTISSPSATGLVIHDGGQVAFQTEPLEITGQLVGTIRRDENLKHDMSGDADEMAVASASVALEAGQRGFGLWLAGIACVALAAVGLPLARRQWSRGARATRFASRALGRLRAKAPREAQVLAERSLALKASPEAHETAGEALSAQGKHAEAVKHHDAADAFFAPGDEEFFAHNARQAARAAARAGRLDLAEQWLDRVLEIDPDFAFDALNDAELRPLRPRYAETFSPAYA